MSKGTGIAAGQILGFPDFVQAVVLVANTGQAFDTPAGMGSVLFSMNADFYARYGSTAAAVPTTSSTAATGSELNPTARNIGSSLFISVCVTEIVRTQGANYSRMTEYITLYNKVLTLPWAMGAWTVDTQSGLAQLSKEINRQAAMIGYDNAFGFYTATSAGAILLISMAKKRQRKAAA